MAAVCASTPGVRNLSIARLLDILHDLPRERKDPADEHPGRVLDTEIEAQVHGPIDLDQDVELWGGQEQPTRMLEDWRRGAPASVPHAAGPCSAASPYQLEGRL